MRYGLDEPDPSVVLLGKNGDPQQALKRCHELIQLDNEADANILLDYFASKNFRAFLKSMSLAK